MLNNIQHPQCVSQRFSHPDIEPKSHSYAFMLLSDTGNGSCFLFTLDLCRHRLSKALWCWNGVRHCWDEVKERSSRGSWSLPWALCWSRIWWIEMKPSWGSKGLLNMNPSISEKGINWRSRHRWKIIDAISTTWAHFTVQLTVVFELCSHFCPVCKSSMFKIIDAVVTFCLSNHKTAF